MTWVGLSKHTEVLGVHLRRVYMLSNRNVATAYGVITPHEELQDSDHYRDEASDPEHDGAELDGVLEGEILLLELLVAIFVEDGDH